MEDIPFAHYQSKYFAYELTKRYPPDLLKHILANRIKKQETQRPNLDDAGQPHNPPKYIISNSAAMLSQIRGLTFLRNQVGAHFNVAGSAISDADVQLFADTTVKLAETLSCPTCGQIPGKKTTTHFQYSCPVPLEVRMLPLQL